MSGALDEPAQRSALARCAELLWQRKLVTGTSGNLSVRLAPDRFLVTASGTMFDRVDPDMLVAVDGRGRVLDATAGVPTSELPLHLASYEASAQIHAVIHAHPTYCVVWAGLGRLFPLDTVAAKESLGAVSWVPYFEPGSAQLGAAVQTALAGDAAVAIMERHGAVAVGPTLESALAKIDLAEECAKVAFLTLVGRTFAAAAAIEP